MILARMEGMGSWAEINATYESIVNTKSKVETQVYQPSSGVRITKGRGKEEMRPIRVLLILNRKWKLSAYLPSSATRITKGGGKAIQSDCKSPP